MRSLSATAPPEGAVSKVITPSPIITCEHLAPPLLPVILDSRIIPFIEPLVVSPIMTLFSADLIPYFNPTLPLVDDGVAPPP